MLWYIYELKGVILTYATTHNHPQPPKTTRNYPQPLKKAPTTTQKLLKKAKTWRKQ